MRFVMPFLHFDTEWFDYYLHKYSLRFASHFLGPNYTQEWMHNANKWFAFNSLKCRPRCLDNNTFNYFNDSRWTNVANFLLTFHFEFFKLHFDWKCHCFRLNRWHLINFKFSSIYNKHFCNRFITFCIGWQAIH